MKHTITILFLLFFCNGYSQEWRLRTINKKAKFKYEYWFQFDNKDDVSSYTLEKMQGLRGSTIKLTDNNGKIGIPAIIEIKNLQDKTIENLLTTSKNIELLELKSGNYNIKVSSINYKDLSFNFNLSENEWVKINAKLALSPDLTVYQINSKGELKEDELNKIIDCVKENRKDFCEKCSDYERYYISMQI